MKNQKKVVEYPQLQILLCTLRVNTKHNGSKFQQKTENRANNVSCKLYRFCGIGFGTRQFAETGMSKSLA